MSESSQASSPSSFFNLHVEGVGYLNRVRTMSATRSSTAVSAVLTPRKSSSGWKLMSWPTRP